MKKTALLLVFMLIVSLITGCAGTPDVPENTASPAENTEDGTEMAKEETKPYTLPRAMPTIQNLWTEWPDYTLSAGASSDEMRAASVQAMHDWLTVKWIPVHDFAYSDLKNSGKGRTFEFKSSVIYGGLPYDGGNTGVFQYLANMDPENGVLYECDFSTLSSTLGATCSTTCCWGVLASCSSPTASYATYGLTKANGFYPLGNVDYPDSMTDYHNMSTTEIVANHDAQTLYEAYALIKPADVVVSTGDDDTDNHAMMAISAADVVRNDDGAIDPEKSTIHIQDQRMGEHLEEVDGDRISIRGRLDAEYTFAQLYGLNYIAVTTKEFQGEKAYDVPEASLNKTVETLKDLQGAKVISNYPNAVITILIYDESGKRVERLHADIGQAEFTDKTARAYPVKSLLTTSYVKKNLENGEKYRFVMETVLSTGTRITLFDGALPIE